MPESSQDEPRTEVSALLGEIRRGDPGAGDQLLSLVYTELRGLAGVIAPRSGRDHTLQPTALVHEAWIKLAGNIGAANDRAHFFAIAAKAMRQVLADHAKAQRRQKRGGGARRLTLFDDQPAKHSPDVDLIAFADSLDRLESLNERQARVVELRLLGALTVEETATMLGVSPGTVKTDWSMARAWMMRELMGDQ